MKENRRKKKESISHKNENIFGERKNTTKTVTYTNPKSCDTTGAAAATAWGQWRVWDTHFNVISISSCCTCRGLVEDNKTRG